MKTFLLFLTLTFSIGAFSQTNPGHPYPPDPKSKALFSKPAGVYEAALKKNGLPADKDYIKDIARQNRDLLSEIQIYDSIYLWQWDTFSTKWALFAKAINIVYNMDGLPTSYTYQSLNGNTWVNAFQYNFTYDANNNTLSQTYKGWNGSSFQNLFRDVNTYDANNNLTSDTYQEWNGTAFDNVSKYIYTYDGNNLQTSSLYQDWTGTIFENYALYTYSHDANGNLTSELDQNWNDIDLVWENSSRYVYTYDGNNNQLTYLYQYWNTTIVDWDNSGLYSYTYDANNKQTNALFQYWDATQWVNYSNTMYTYNASNDLTNSFTQYWNVTNWENGARTNISYNGNHQPIRSLSEGWTGSWIYTNLAFNTYGENDFLESYSSRSFDSDGVIVTDGDSTFNFFHTITGIHDVNSDDPNVTVSPNPSSGKFVISSKDALQDVAVYNLLGERILSVDQARGLTSAEIDLAGYGKGIYIINVRDGNKISNRKVAVQ